MNIYDRCTRGIGYLTKSSEVITKSVHMAYAVSQYMHKQQSRVRQLPLYRRRITQGQAELVSRDATNLYAMVIWNRGSIDSEDASQGTLHDA